MKRQRRIAGNTEIPILKVFILCLLVSVYTGFLLIDMFSLGFMRVSDGMKYCGMLLVLLLALLMAHEGRTSGGKIVIAALCFTLTADFLLLFAQRHEAGVAIFCGAHLCYILRYRKKLFLPMLVFSLAAGAAVFVCTVRGMGIPQIHILAGLYAVLIITASVSAWTSKLPRVNKLLASVGMACFLLCDLNVAAFNTLPGYQIHRGTGMLIWFFYLPAQMMIALSIGNYPEGERAA